VLWPKAGFTKGEAIDYYARIADTILPHLAGRPLTRVRFPNGTAEKSFYEKRAPSHTPDWVKTAPLEFGNEGLLHFIVCDERATLIWLAQLAALELHPSLSLAKDVERPTFLVFDLDPGAPADILDCCRVGLTIRAMFENLGLESLAKTSGSKGLQLYVPLNTKVTYEQTKPFSHAVAQTLERDDPKRVLSKMKRSLRKGKVFVDWSQNDRAKTTVAVYSLRNREHPTVSTPVTWDEVDRALSKEDPDLLRFEAPDVLKRVKKHGDLFEPVLKLKQRLPKSTPGN
jgi:bifunctional non-homologous end joining protein LigD